MTETLKIDSEFEKVIPPLSEDEFAQLEANILAEGEVFTPIFVWKGIIIDGHHRYKIICAHPEIKYRVSEKMFANRYETIAWICDNQLGRRNMTEKDREYLIGKRYDCERMAHGASDGFRGNRYTELVTDQSDPLLKTEGSHVTRQRIAQETGTSEGYVERASKFAKGVDAADEAVPGIKKEILSGQIKPTKPEVIAIASASPEERQQMVENLRKPKEKRDLPKHRGLSQQTPEELKRLYRSIEAISSDMERPKGATDMDNILGIIDSAAQNFEQTCDYYLGRYPELLEEQEHNEKLQKTLKTLNEYISKIERKEEYEKDTELQAGGSQQ